MTNTDLAAKGAQKFEIVFLFNEFIMNILNDKNTLSCPRKNKSNTFVLTVQTSCYRGLRLTLCLDLTVNNDKSCHICIMRLKGVFVKYGKYGTLSIYKNW